MEEAKHQAVLLRHAVDQQLNLLLAETTILVIQEMFLFQLLLELCNVLIKTYFVLEKIAKTGVVHLAYVLMGSV